MVALANALALALLCILLFLPEGARGPFAAVCGGEPGPGEGSQSFAHAATASTDAAPQSAPGSNLSHAGSAPPIIGAASLSGESASAFDALRDGRSAAPSATSQSESSSLYPDASQPWAPGLAARSDGATGRYFALYPGDATGLTNRNLREITVPLAFTTSDDGATASQQATLERLRSEFANGLDGQPADPNSAEYARLWRQEQAASDSSYEQQFGTEAFIQAQLAQVHGGAN